MSLLLDALKQAANSKTQTDKAVSKTASKQAPVSDSTTEKDNNNITASSDTNTSLQQTKTEAQKEITLELEEIAGELQQDLEPDLTNTEKKAVTDEEQQKTSPETSELNKLHQEESITIEMDHFDPEEQNKENDELKTAESITAADTISVETTSGEIPAPRQNLSDTNKAEDNKEKKSRVMAPENAKIILNPDKKPKRAGTFMVIGLLAFAVLAAGGFLGYLYYLEQDEQISSNIADLSRHPTAKIKPIDDLSNISDEITEVDKQESTSETANQTLQGSIAATQVSIATAQDSIAAIGVQSDDKVGTQQTTELSAKPIDTVKTEPKKPLIQTQPNTQKSDEISAEELPPTLSSVINSHPFIEHTPLEQLPVVIEQPISITKNNNEALASKNINLGYKYFETGNYQLAKQYYQKAIELAPNDTDTFLGLAAIALIENDTDTAIKFYTQALQLDPQNTTATSAISSIYNKRQNDESTIKRNIAANPQNPWAYFNLGNYHMDMQNWSKALQAFSKANSIAPQTPDILFNIAISLDNLDRVTKAIDAYNMAISAARLKPANFDAVTVQNYVDSLSLQPSNK